MIQCRIIGEAAMGHLRQLTGLTMREGDGYVALCPDLDIASQGDTIEQARTNLIEAVELFFETAIATENRRPTARRTVCHRHRGECWIGCASCPARSRAASSRRRDSSRSAAAPYPFPTIANFARDIAIDHPAALHLPSRQAGHSQWRHARNS
jgi:predicted RNase H-like HicB family nuclease